MGLPFGHKIHTGKLLILALVKVWFLAVCPALLVPDLRQSLDAGLPDFHSYNHSCTCSRYHCKPAIEQAEAKSDSATSTPPPAPHSTLCSVCRKVTQGELCLCQALTNFRCQLPESLYPTWDVASPLDFSREQPVTRELSDAEIEKPDNRD